ncbi:tripartite tricarboxylate transporter substrate-binding protein, partial [Acinetobacter baumannii]
TSMPFIKEGKVRAVAGFPAKPIPELADTPPATQAIPGFSIDLWHGVVAPAGMDPALVSHINSIFNKVLELPAVRTAISQAQA